MRANFSPKSAVELTNRWKDTCSRRKSAMTTQSEINWIIERPKLDNKSSVPLRRSESALGNEIENELTFLVGALLYVAEDEPFEPY